MTIQRGFFAGVEFLSLSPVKYNTGILQKFCKGSITFACANPSDIELRGKFWKNTQFEVARHRFGYQHRE